jgi:hypothetical protein
MRLDRARWVIDQFVDLHFLHLLVDLLFFHRIVLSPLCQNFIFDKLVSSSTLFECSLGFLEMRTVVPAEVKRKPCTKRSWVRLTQVRRR